ncbi:hypothetical protein HYY69_03315 [Candidatus Woesearchaeota archaeon]|nr:hypothetical protein [Candidatus Woesearchaeota archaeon]
MEENESLWTTIFISLSTAFIFLLRDMLPALVREIFVVKFFFALLGLFFIIYALVLIGDYILKLKASTKKILMISFLIFLLILVLFSRNTNSCNIQSDTTLKDCRCYGKESLPYLEDNKTITLCRGLIGESNCFIKNPVTGEFEWIACSYIE